MKLYDGVVKRYTNTFEEAAHVGDNYNVYENCVLYSVLSLEMRGEKKGVQTTYILVYRKVRRNPCTYKTI